MQDLCSSAFYGSSLEWGISAAETAGQDAWLVDELKPRWTADLQMREHLAFRRWCGRRLRHT
ncbi:hypothetical protein EAS62_31825 [Bradyrhizobium zhanjiangense]|uniref:Uncharacterized protein n=1 Tax=Bradyrhizobium zhanjiangense TaxID=1325107 RepID=A0ABY0DDJ3_9BRAD|nr:hypothetical protein EAS62_31825 [Bradyrhizobium zhanjiangense]